MADNLRCLCTLPQLRVRQKLATADTSDDLRLLQKIRAATSEIERFVGQDFQPTLETRDFDWESTTYVSFRSFKALKLNSVTDGIGQVVSTSAMAQLGSRSSTFGTPGPCYGIEAIPALGGYFFYLYTKRRCMLVNAVWGVHNDYANAWVNSNVQVGAGGWSTASAGASQTVLCSTNDQTIADAYGRNWNFTKPVVAQYGTIHAGHLIQVDSEWMQVVAVPDSTHLTIIRGVNGSTPALHTATTAIYIYETPRDINDIAITWAAWLYYQDSVGFEKVAIPAVGGGTIKVTQDPTANLKDKLLAYLNVRVA